MALQPFRFRAHQRSRNQGGIVRSRAAAAQRVLYECFGFSKRGKPGKRSSSYAGKSWKLSLANSTAAGNSLMSRRKRSCGSWA